jgi:hypothetical protein
MVLLMLLMFFKPALLVFKPADLTVRIFSLSLFVSFGHVELPGKFFTYEGAAPYQSSAQMSCREEAGVSFVALGILEPQPARH